MGITGGVPVSVISEKKGQSLCGCGKSHVISQKKKAAYVVLFVMQLHNPQNGKSQKCLRHSQLYASTMRSIESNIMAFIRQQQPFRHTKHHRYERIGIATVH